MFTFGTPGLMKKETWGRFMAPNGVRGKRLVAGKSTRFLRSLDKFEPILIRAATLLRLGIQPCCRTKRLARRKTFGTDGRRWLPVTRCFSFMQPTADYPACCISAALTAQLARYSTSPNTPC